MNEERSTQKIFLAKLSEQELRPDPTLDGLTA